MGDSIIVQKVDPIRVASDTLDADLEVGREVLTYLADHPKASQNEIQRELQLGRSGTWPKLRDLLLQLGYLEAVTDPNGKVRQVKTLQHGLLRH